MDYELNPVDYMYRRGLAGPLSELLKDPLSTLSRKRQVALLSAAALCLLLSLPGTSLEQIKVSTFLGSFVFTIKVASWAAWAVTLYLAGAYYLSVMADRAVAKAFRWSANAQVADVEAAMKSEQARIDGLAAENTQKINAYRAAVDQNKEDEDAELVEFADQISNVDATTLKGQREKAELEQKTWEIQEKYRHQRDRLFAELDPPPFEEYHHKVSVLWTEEDLQQALGRYRSLSIWRGWLEIVFPLVFALTILVWTLVVRLR